MAELADQYISDFLNDTMRSVVVESTPKLPASMRKKACAVGIDEAGRGPVLGPMVYSAFACCIDDVQKLRSAHVADSKVLNEEQRERIFESLCELRDTTVWCAKVLAPAHISSSMLSRSKYNLNELSQDTAALLIRKLIDDGVNVTRVYVDTVGDPNKYRSRLASQFSESIQFTVCPKADSLYPEVSAASICAKVLRDQCIKGWRLNNGIRLRSSEDMVNGYGSGYPGDPQTKTFLRAVFDPVFGFPDLVRFSWSTADQIMLKDGVSVRWSDEADQNANTTSFRAASRKRPAAGGSGANADEDKEEDENANSSTKRAAGRKQKPVVAPAGENSLTKFLFSKRVAGTPVVGGQVKKLTTTGDIPEKKEADSFALYKRSPDVFKLLSLALVKSI